MTIDTIIPDVELVLLLVLISFVSSLIGALSTTDASKFYNKQLKKPKWAPPSWLFAIVWFFLYILLGVSYWLIRRGEEMSSIIAETFFWYFLLVTLALWPWLFFKWKLLKISAVWIIFVLIIEIVMVILFGLKKGWLPSFLNCFLIIWTLYATVLNIWIAIKNPKIQRQRKKTKTKNNNNNNEGNGEAFLA